MVKKRQIKVYITEVNTTRRPPLARAREVVSGSNLTISLDINRGEIPSVGEIWWVQYLGTRWALYARVTSSSDTSDTTDDNNYNIDVSSTTLDLFFQVKEQAQKLAYYPLVKFNSALVSGDSANVANYIISWTKCTRVGGTVRDEKAQQYTWNPNEKTDGADDFVDVGPGELYDYAVEIPFEVDNPKTSYYKARIRAVSKVNSVKGTWSPWTRPKLPIRNSLNGPPAVTDVELNFEAKEVSGGKLDYRAIVNFKDVGYWDIPGFDFEDDVEKYDVQLQPLEKKFTTLGIMVYAGLAKSGNTIIFVDDYQVTQPPNYTPFDVLIGNEVIGISRRVPYTYLNKEIGGYEIETRGKYGTLAKAHALGTAVKEYDVNAWDTNANLVPVDPDTIPAFRSTVSNKDETPNKLITTINDVDQDDSSHSWPRVGKLKADINGADTEFNVAVSNEKLLRNLPTVLKGSYLFKIAINKEIIGITDWTYNLGVLHLVAGTPTTTQRGIDDTEVDEHSKGAKVRLISWVSVGYLEADITEENNTLTVVEDRLLDFDSNNDGIDEDFTIRIDGEKMQVISRNYVDSFTVNNVTSYIYEYEVYRAIQNTDINFHSGGSGTVVEIDLGYYYAAVFETIPKPRKLFWRARVRAVDRFGRNGIWSDWTDPLNASQDADILAPAPTGVTINFKRKHRNRGWSIKAQVGWDKVSYEIPGGDTIDDVKGYQPRLLSSDGSKLAERVGFESFEVTSRYLTNNLAYLVLNPKYITEYTFAPSQLINVNLSTPNRADIDESVYNGNHRVLSYDWANHTVIFYKEHANLDLENTTGTVTTAQTIIKVFEPDKTNSTQRQLGSDGTGYIFLTSFDRPEGVTIGEAENKDYYEMMYVKDSWKSDFGDYYEYLVVRGVLGTTPRDFGTQWMQSDITEPIKPMLVFTYPAAFEATKLVDADNQELEPYGGVRINHMFGPVRRQFWYVSQVRTLDTYNRVGEWSQPSSPATALDNIRPPQPYNINVIPYTNYVKVDWDIQPEPGVFLPTYIEDKDGNGELNPDDFEIVSSDVSYFKVQLWSEDPHAEAPDEQQAFGLNGDPTYSNGVVTLTTDQEHTFAVGDKVIIRGCWPNAINGEHKIKNVPNKYSFKINVTLDAPKPPFQIDGMVYKKGEKQALDLYKQYPIHFFRKNSLNGLTTLRLAEKGDIAQVVNSGKDNGYYELMRQNYKLLSNWKKVAKQKVQIPGLLFYDRYVNLTSRNVPVRKLTNKVWARICSVDEAGNQSEWISAGPFNAEFIPGPEWVLTRLIHEDKGRLDAKVQWSEVTSPDFTVGSYNIELQAGRLYAQLYGDSMDFWGLDPNQDIVFGMLSFDVTANATDTTLNVTEFGDSADTDEYIKIGDELIRVISREASDDINGFIDAVYEVERGVLGTTAATHSTGALILRVQSEAIVVREIYNPIETANLDNNASYDIVIGNERMKVLNRVPYSSSTYGVAYGSTSPSSNPSGTWTAVSSSGIGTPGNGSTSQNGSSSVIYSLIQRPTLTEGVWIAATSTGIWTSTNLTTWTQRNTTTNLRSVASDGAVWIAVGDGGKILTSVDPTSSWRLSNQLPFGTDDIYSVKYGDGNWVIAGENNKIAVTTNPIRTTYVNFIDSGDLVGLTNHGLVDGDKISFSSVNVTTGISADTNYYVVNAAVDTFQVSTTAGGTPLTLTTDGYGNVYYTLWTLVDPDLDVPVDIFDKSLLNGVATLSITSTANVIVGSQISVSNLGSPFDGDHTVTAVSAGSIALTSGSLAVKKVSYSTSISDTVTSTGSAAAPVYTSTASPYQRGMATNMNSTTGMTISPKINAQTSLSTATSVGLLKYSLTINSVAFGAGYWAVACDEGVIAATSNPLGAWTQVATSVTEKLNAITYSNGYWVTVGNSGRILTSVNPLSTWTIIAAGISNNLYDVSFGASNWVAVGSTGKIITASNPTKTIAEDPVAGWTSVTSGTTTNLYTVAFGNDATTSEWMVAGTSGAMRYAATSSTDGITGNIWVYLVLRDRNWGSTLGQIEDFQHPDLTPIFDSIADRDATRTGAAKADRDNNDFWDYLFKDVKPTLFYRSRVQGVLKSGVKGNWSNYTLWADPNDLTAPQQPIVEVDFDARVLNVVWVMPDEVTNQVYSVENFDEMLDLSTAQIGDIAVFSTVVNGITSVYAYRLVSFPSDVSSNWVATISPINAAGEKIDVSNDYLYKASSAAFYQVQVSRIPKKWEAVASLGHTLEKISDGTGNWNFFMDPGQKLEKYPKVGNKIKVGPGPNGGGTEIMTLATGSPTTAADWQKPKVKLFVNRSLPSASHSKGALVQWVKQDGTEFYDPIKPFKYKWIWKDDRFVTEMSKSYVADHIKKYLFTVRVRAVDGAGNFSPWNTLSVSPSGVPTPDVEDLEFTDIDNTPETLEGVLTFTGSMDVTENITQFVTELMPTQQIRILNDLPAKSTGSGRYIYVKKKNKVLNPADVGDYLAFIEDEKVLVTALDGDRPEAPVTYQGVAAYKLTVTRGYQSTTVAAHAKHSWLQWFHHFSVKETIEALQYTPSLDATVDPDSGTIISTVPALGRYKAIFTGIKTGRWYKGRAKAINDDGKSSSWSDWSDPLRGEKDSSLSGGTNAGPRPVRNLIMDVDAHHIHVAWLPPRLSESAVTTSSALNATLTASTNRVALASHGYSNNDIVVFDSVTSGTGILANVSYYVINSTSSDFQLSTDPDGTTIDIIANGTAVIDKTAESITISTIQQYTSSLSFLTADQLAYYGWETVPTVARVTTTSPHNFHSAQDYEVADMVSINGAYPPFNGDFPVLQNLSTTSFLIPVYYTSGDATYYDASNPLDGTTTDAVVTLASTDQPDGPTIDHYIVSIKRAQLVNGSDVPTWTEIKAGKKWAPDLRTDKNCQGTFRSFKIGKAGPYTYYAKVIAVDSSGKKSKPRYAKGNKKKPPKPTISSVQIAAGKHQRRYLGKILITQPSPVTDKDITKYIIEWFVSKNKVKDPAEVDGRHSKSVHAKIIEAGKKVRVGHLRPKRYLFVRVASQNADGTASDFTKWRRKKIITKL